jgi:hypothetical protein
MKPGDYVRFAALPADCNPRPLRVSVVFPNGMLMIYGKEGIYAASLFVAVPPPPTNSHSEERKIA